jgi:rhamnose utilization protein RhaD (predicted bifunctional aldolase and dehydrogenase)
MILETLTRFSNKFGSDGELVLAGGGNTSAKEDGVLYVKGSGTSLATITADGFVKMDRSLLSRMLKKEYPAGDREREAEALKELMAVRLPSEMSKRPSVETLLHNLFPQRYVLHLHPAIVNGLTCAKNGENEAKRLFGEDVLWIGLCKPGYVLSKLCCEKMEDYKTKNGRDVSVMLLQNHGIFVAADSETELEAKLNTVIGTLKAQLKETPDMSPQQGENELAEKYKSKIITLYESRPTVIYDGNAQAASFAQSRSDAGPLLKPFTPDHIVYCRAHPLFSDSVEALDSDFAGYRAAHGYPPKIIIAKGLGFFAVAENGKQAETARLLFNDAIKIAVYSKSFGGALHMTDELTDFIINWEVESYRSSQNN